MIITFEKITALLVSVCIGSAQFVLSQVAPKLTPMSRESEFKRGERFQLVCSCREGEPPLTFNWMRNGQPLTETVEVSIRRFDEFSSSITISAVREDHAGNYTCIVSNLGGTDSSTVRLKVLVPPTWLRQPHDMSVLSGTRVTLNCETAGTPKPTVVWRRNKGFNGQQMEPLGSTHWRTGDDGSLTTSNIKKDDKGFYSCEVTNGVGDGLRKTARIIVQVPPFVWISDAIQTVKKGQMSRMKCEVTGDSPLSITWTKANQQYPLSNDKRIKIQEETLGENTSSSITIPKTLADDTGLYFCSSRNNYGLSQATIRLHVVEYPSPPQNFRVMNVWCRSIRLEWKQPYNGNSPIKNYIIGCKKKVALKYMETKVSDSQTLATIHDLKPFTTYEFWIVAENEVGTSGFSENLTVTTREEEPEAAPLNVHVKSKDSTGYTLSWKVPPVEKWNGNLLGFLIGYKRVSHGSVQAVPFTYKVFPVHNKLEVQELYVGGLQESSSYTVAVRAFNNAGIGPTSEQILVKTSSGESPQVPSLTILNTGQTAIELKVETNGRHKATPTQYVLHIREGSGHWLKLPLVPYQQKYIIGGLNPGGHYKLYITAKNKFGDSGPSEVLIFRTESEDAGGSVFHYEEDIAIPFYQRLYFIIPVAVSLTTILVVPIAACCCLQKLSNLPATRPEGVEARGFTYTAASSSAVQCQTLPPVPGGPSSTASQGHYSTLQNYGSVIPPNPRFSHLLEDTRVSPQISVPIKNPSC